MTYVIVRDFLKICDLEDMIPVFESNGIDDSRLQKIHKRPEIINSLLSTAAKQIDFWDKYDDYIASLSIVAHVDSISDDSVNPITPPLDTNSVDNIENQQPGPSTSDLSMPTTSVIVVESEFGEASSDPLQELRNRHNEGVIQGRVKNLQHLLQSSTEGDSLLSFYETHKYFQSKHQNELASLIVSHELKYSGDDKRVPLDRFLIWSSAIAALFPSEIQATYYVPHCSVKGRQFTRASGKLYKRYHNVRENLFKCNLLKRPEKEAVLTVNTHRHLARSIPLELTSDIESALAWLQRNRSPWNEVKTNWDITTVARYNEILRGEQSSTEEHLFLYKPYELPEGYKLISHDYDHLPVQVRSEVDFFARFNELRSIIAEIASEEGCPDNLIRTFSSCSPSNTDTKDFCIFMLLPQLIPATSRAHIVGSKRRRWRPSLAEVQLNFIVHLKTLTELETAKQQRKDAAAVQSVPIQPVLYVIAHDIQKIDQVYVSIAHLCYKVDSVSQGIDILFKSFHTLNISYPTASEHIWLAIQCAFYRYNLSGTTFIAVNNFIGRLKGKGVSFE